MPDLLTPPLRLSPDSARLTSVERCDQYIRSLDYEAASHVPEHAPPADWPQRGGLELRQVCLRYRPDLPRVLHSVSLLVRPAEKLGVVGRTGAGQSLSCPTLNPGTWEGRSMHASGANCTFY